MHYHIDNISIQGDDRVLDREKIRAALEDCAIARQEEMRIARWIQTIRLFSDDLASLDEPRNPFLDGEPVFTLGDVLKGIEAIALEKKPPLTIFAIEHGETTWPCLGNFIHRARIFRDARLDAKKALLTVVKEPSMRAQ